MGDEQNQPLDLATLFKSVLAVPDSESKAKRPDPEELRKAEDHRRVKLKNNAEELEQELKARIFSWVQYVVSIYLGFVGLVIICMIIGAANKQSNLLSDKVLIALLTTTTVNVLGLPYLIIRALFKSKNEKKKSKKES